MTFNEPRRRTLWVGDLDGPYLRDFVAAWEDDIRAADERKHPVSVVRQNVILLRARASNSGYADGAGPYGRHLQDIGHNGCDEV